MAYKKLFKICDNPDDTEFIYKGEKVTFTFKEDYENDDFEIMEGELVTLKNEFTVKHLNRRIKLLDWYYLEHIVILDYEKNESIRKFFDEKGKVKEDGKEVVKD